MFRVPESPQVPQYCLQWALNLASKLVDPGRLVGVQPPLVVELDDVVLVVLEVVEVLLDVMVLLLEVMMVVVELVVGVVEVVEVVEVLEVVVVTRRHWEYQSFE